MAAAFLLDAHIDPRVGEILIRIGIEVVPMRAWRGGRYLDETDEDILRAAEEDGLTLITYDVGTIPTLLKQLAGAGRTHGGVILISAKTVEQRAIGEIGRTIASFVSSLGDLDWRNQVLFLPKP